MYNFEMVRMIPKDRATRCFFWDGGVVVVVVRVLDFRSWLVCD